MSTTTVTIVRCDLCRKELGEQAGEPVYRGETHIAGSVWRFDACSECATQLTAEMEPVVTEQPAEVPGIDLHTCLICHTTFGSRGAFTRHRDSAHPESYLTA